MSADSIKILKGLEKVENSLARIYKNLSENETFSQAVRKFWETIGEEELRHAEVFRTLREELESDPEFDFSIDLDWYRLKVFADQAKEAVARAKEEDITEAEAYSLGARIEGDLDESKFFRMAITGKEEIRKQINRIDAETRKHMMIMANYAKGVK